jgi:ferredoxin, 2Fe-2S
MKVKFLPQNVEHEIPSNQSVLDLANEHGIYIKSVCRGLPSCAECRVRVVQGEHNVVPPSAKELNLIGTAYFVDQRRLSCQLKCFGDITVDMTEQNEKQNQTVKRARGSITREADESQARTGNFIHEAPKVTQAPQQTELVKREDEKRRLAEAALTKEEQRRELERIRARHRRGPTTAAQDEDNE